MFEFEYLIFYLNAPFAWLLAILWFQNNRLARIAIPPVFMMLMFQIFAYFDLGYLDPFFLIAAIVLLLLGGAIVMVLELLKFILPNIVLEKAISHKIWISPVLVMMMILAILPLSTSSH